MIGGLPERPAQPPAPGFRPRPSRPGLRGRTKPEWVRQEVLSLHTDGVGGCRTVAQTFNRLHAHAGMTVGKTFVSEAIRRHPYRTNIALSASKHRLPRQTPPNRRWELDATGKGDTAGQTHAILGIVDHGTRLNVALSILRRLSAWRILGHLFLAIDEFGCPRAIRTDNAAVFRSGVFRTVLAIVGIRHELTGLACPWQNGRIERFFRTLKEQLDGIEVDNGAALNGLLAPFAFWYNAVRPHQHLHGLTPLEAWNGIDPYGSTPREVQPFSAWGGQLRGYYLRR